MSHTVKSVRCCAVRELHAMRHSHSRSASTSRLCSIVSTPPPLRASGSRSVARGRVGGWLAAGRRSVVAGHRARVCNGVCNDLGHSLTLSGTPWHDRRPWMLPHRPARGTVRHILTQRGTTWHNPYLRLRVLQGLFSRMLFMAVYGRCRAVDRSDVFLSSLPRPASARQRPNGPLGGCARWASHP